MKKAMLSIMLVVIMLSFWVAGCTPSANPSTPEQAVSTEAPTEEPTEIPEVSEPPVGGTLHIGIDFEPGTYDIHKMSGWDDTQMAFFNGTLVAFNPDTNELSPYLAESWTISEDGLIYTFKLQEGVKFHNGDTLTAKDWCYTFERAMAPETASPVASTSWGLVTNCTVVDDYTMSFTISEPSYTFLMGLNYATAGPVSKRAIEELGADYGQQAVGVGPYLLKEYVSGEKIVYERNPEYTWGPSWVHKGPAYIQTVEYRIIPEYSTLIAGLESGDLDIIPSVDYSDISRFEGDGRFTKIEGQQQGMNPLVVFNVTKPPFDDIRVRKAFNLAINREDLVTIVLKGNGMPLYGPITANTLGYDPIVESLGYHYDLEQAKALMQEAGYTYDSGGMLLTPEGQPFVLDLITSTYGTSSKNAEVLVEQFRALGVQMTIQLLDSSIVWDKEMAGDFQITATYGLGWYDAEIMRMGMHSSQMGSLNIFQVQDPVLDEILDRTITTVDPTLRQEAVTEAQKYIIEKAYLAPLYSTIGYTALNNRIQGAKYCIKTGQLWYQDAYIAQ